jgi:hypothetical protein
MAEELNLDDALEEAMEERIEDEIGALDEEDRKELVGTTLEAARLDDTASLHKLPVSVGICAGAPFLSTCTPKVVLWPGCKLPFQFTLLAV